MSASVHEQLETVRSELDRKVEELARANGELEDLLAATQLATVFLDAQLRITRFTPAARASCGLLDADVGRPIGEVASRIPGAELLGDVAKARHAGHPVERQVESRDGQEWFLRRVWPPRAAAGADSGAVITLVNVTALKHAERALRASEERFRAFVTASSDVVYRMGPDWNEMRELRGREFIADTEAPTRSWLQQYIYPDDQPSVMAEIAAAIREKRTFELEHRVLRVDGSVGWTFSRAIPLLGANGEIVEWFGAATDVTARKRTEEELRASEARLRLAQGVARVGTFDWDARTGVSTWTPEMEGLYGLPRGGFPGTEAAWEQLVHPDDRAGALRRVQEAYETGAPTSGEWRVIWPDGSVHWIAGRWQVIKDASGAAVRVTGLNFDVTDRKQAEELHASEAALRAADRQKNEFLAMLSHELRNPLAPIRNSLFVLERASPGSERAKRAQAVIERQIAQLTWLIDDLLDVTRIARGKLRLQRARLDLNELAHRAAEDQRTLFVKAGVRLELIPARAEAWVDGDRTRLAQAIGNLLQNAVKFTPRGGKATVSVQLHPDRHEAALTVRDTGEGIAADMLPRLFQAFTQAAATLDRSKGGLGLGLALVKGLVESHGGSVRAESEGPGKGAAFTIVLPLATQTDRALPAPAPAPAATPPRRVLVIEDNEDAADTLREVLELGDHEVEVAYDGREGLQKARSFHPDVVLCDIGLPELDGYEVARTIRSDPELRRMALVAVSGYAQPEDVARAKDAGFDAHLAKPPSVDELEATILEVEGMHLQDGAAPG